MKDALVFPAWTQATGPDHYLLCVLPQQTNSNDCSVFMLMFALHIMLDVAFIFSQALVDFIVAKKGTDYYIQFCLHSPSSEAKRNQSGLTLFPSVLLRRCLCR